MKLCLDFTDFWPGFDKTNNYFYNLLSKHYEITISNKPDFLICSLFGHGYKDYKCPRIVFIGENVRPDLREFDYSFSFDFPVTEKNYRLPLYGLHYAMDWYDMNILTAPKPTEIHKPKFCCMVVSNETAKERIGFFHKLSKYKKVDSGGKLLNNVGGPVPSKIRFLPPYKFNIAFENSSYPGYTTEKIVEPMLTHTIPIYWGNPLVGLDFNTNSFINVQDEDEAIERIIAIDQSDDLYQEIMQQPYYANNKVNEFVSTDNVLGRFRSIFH